MIGQKMFLIKMWSLWHVARDFVLFLYPRPPTLNQVVITTTTTKILPCLPCVLSNPLQRAHRVPVRIVLGKVRRLQVENNDQR